MRIIDSRLMNSSDLLFLGRYQLYYIFNIISSERQSKSHENSMPSTKQPKIKVEASNHLEKLSANEKAYLQINTRKGCKQNQQKMYFQGNSRQKIKTFISLPKNRKNSMPYSNSSLEKKLFPQNKQKILNFAQTQPLRSYTKASQTMSDQLQTHQVFEVLLSSSIAIEQQNRQINIIKKDLLTLISLLLNTDASLSENKRFLPLWRLLKEWRSYSDKVLQQTTTRPMTKRLKLQSAAIKLAYIPFVQPKKTLSFCNKILQHTYKHRHQERNSYQYEIRRLRDSLLSQQNLVTNIKNCQRVKHPSRQDDKLDIFSRPNVQSNLAVEYMMEQNQLLMKVANQEFKKYESEIYEYGLLLQSKHLQIDLEYQQFSAQNEQDTSAVTLQESLRLIILNQDKTDHSKYEQLSNSLRTFLEKMHAKDQKLKKLIEIKSTFIAQFSSKMEFWIQSLAFKKEFTENLANYIEKQCDQSQELISMLSKTAQCSCPGMLGKLQELRRGLQVFFQNLLNSHQFS